MSELTLFDTISWGPALYVTYDIRREGQAYRITSNFELEWFSPEDFEHHRSVFSGTIKATPIDNKLSSGASLLLTFDRGILRRASSLT